MPHLETLRKLIDSRLENSASIQKSIIQDAPTSGVSSVCKRDVKAANKKAFAKSEQIDQIDGGVFPKRKNGADNLKADFRPNWFDRVEFKLLDAAKYLEKYADNEEKDFTHIYSYNKVMS